MEQVRDPARALAAPGQQQQLPEQEEADTRARLGNDLNDEEEGGEPGNDISDVEDEDGDEPAKNLPMNLSDTERQWALTIRQLIQDSPELSEPPLNDFMIAQIALVSIVDGQGGDLALARQRILKLQEMRQNIQVDESLENGRDILKMFVQDILHGFFLGFYFHPEDKSYVLVVDLTNFDMSIFRDDDKCLIWLKGLYYINHCHNADLAAVRNGMIGIAECQGYYWKSQDVFQVKALQEWSEMACAYPLHYCSVKLFHGGLFLNLMLSMGKRFLPTSMARSLSYGCVSPSGRLDQLYLLPSLEMANQRLLNRLYQALELRYENEASFTL